MTQSLEYSSFNTSSSLTDLSSAQRLEEIMKRTRKSDAGDKVAGIKPILEKNSMF